MSDLPFPRLLHPVLVKIRKRDLAGTKYDREAREPVGKVARGTTTSLYAQVHWKSAQIVAKPEGNLITTDGYLLFLRTDLDTLGIDIEYHDQIVEIGESASLVPVNLYVEMIQYKGHNPNALGYTLVKAWFSDKGPVRHS
jgi:hypothetical protein